jgi:hypothetical protein
MPAFSDATYSLSSHGFHIGSFQGGYNGMIHGHFFAARKPSSLCFAFITLNFISHHERKYCGAPKHDGHLRSRRMLHFHTSNPSIHARGLPSHYTKRDHRSFYSKMQTLRSYRCEHARIRRSISSPNIEGLQNHIASAEQLIAEGIQNEELEKTLPSMKQMLADEIKATELRMVEVWKEYWAIWGPGEGPEIPNEYPVEEEIQDVVEEPSKDTGGKKRKAPLKIKGRASGKKARKA